MTVQDTVRTVVVPRQPEPADPPLAPPPPAQQAAEPAVLLGRDRPLTADERQFALGLVAVLLALGTIVVTGLLVAQHVWS